VTEKFGPLDGLRVIEIGSTIAGPMTATLLADFGAEVIKIESPAKEDTMRTWSPIKNDLSLWWKMIGRNKKLITLDLKSVDGQELFKKLVTHVDVVIENFRPGTLEKWNIGYDTLSKINRGIVLLRISGYGQDGPYSKKAGYGTIAEAMSGIPSFTGFPDSPPTLSAFPLADMVTSIFGSSSVMFAIYNRDKNGGDGQVIDLSLYESMLRLIDPMVIGYDQLEIVKQRNGNRMEEDAPRNTYLTKDKHWLAISASSDKTFERLAIAIGIPQITNDPRFIDNPNRVKNVEALDEIIGGWIATKTINEVNEIFELHDVISGPIYDIKTIFDDIQVKARENIVSIMDRDLGDVKVQNVVPKFSKTPGRVEHLGLNRGEHNEQIYCEYLGLSKQEFEVLIQKKVI
jgi:succinyl-CoA--D-citramalate CoA-transferase